MPQTILTANVESAYENNVCCLINTGAEVGSPGFFDYKCLFLPVLNNAMPSKLNLFLSEEVFCGLNELSLSSSWLPTQKNGISFPLYLQSCLDTLRALNTSSKHPFGSCSKNGAESQSKKSFLTFVEL